MAEKGSVPFSYLLALLLAWPAGAWQLDGTRITDHGRPIAVRALVYPVDAPAEGHPLDAPAFAAAARASGVDTLVLTVAADATLDDAEALTRAAADTGLAVVLQPRDAAAVEPVARRLGGLPAVQAWFLPPGCAAPAGATAFTASAEPTTGPLYALVPWLYQGALGVGRWAQEVVARQDPAAPLLARVELAPPAWLVAAGTLEPAAPTYTPQARPETVGERAGEYLLLPEPAQMRLQTYAALGRGARGVVFDHAGHLAPGPDPFNGVDRAAMLSQLGEELGWLGGFIAAGEPLAPPAAPLGVGAGALRLGDETLLLLWRDQRLDTRSVGGGLTDPFEVTVPAAATPGLTVYRLAPEGVNAAPADLREGGVRVTVPDLDLTAAWLITAHPQDELTATIAAALPGAARRALRLAQARLAKVGWTERQLQAAGRSVGGFVTLQRATQRLTEAGEAYSYGYLRTAYELAAEAERLTREAQASAMEAFLTRRLTPAQQAETVTYAALPYVDPLHP